MFIAPFINYLHFQIPMIFCSLASVEKVFIFFYLTVTKVPEEVIKNHHQISLCFCYLLGWFRTLSFCHHTKVFEPEAFFSPILMWLILGINFEIYMQFKKAWWLFKLKIRANSKVFRFHWRMPTYVFENSETNQEFHGTSQ